MPYLESISPHFQYVKIYTGGGIPPWPAAWCGYIYFKPIGAELAKLHSYYCISWYVISCAGCGIVPWSAAYFMTQSGPGGIVQPCLFQSVWCRIGWTTSILLYFTAFPVCKNLHKLRHTSLTRSIFQPSNRALAAFSSHIYFRLFGAGLAEIRQKFIVCSRPRWPAAYFYGPMGPSWLSSAIFISGCLVHNWSNYIHITVFHSISGM